MTKTSTCPTTSRPAGPPAASGSQDQQRAGHGRSRRAVGGQPGCSRLRRHRPFDTAGLRHIGPVSRVRRRRGHARIRPARDAAPTGFGTESYSPESYSPESYSTRGYGTESYGTGGSDAGSGRGGYRPGAERGRDGTSSRGRPGYDFGTDPGATAAGDLGAPAAGGPHGHARPGGRRRAIEPGPNVVRSGPLRGSPRPERPGGLRRRADLADRQFLLLPPGRRMPLRPRATTARDGGGWPRSSAGICG